MAIIPFLNCEGKPVAEIEALIFEKWNTWQKVNNDPLIRVFANLHEYKKQYKAIVACDDDMIIRYIDIKSSKDGKTWSHDYMYSGVYQNLNNFEDIRFICEVENKLSARTGTKLPVCMEYSKKLAIRDVLNKINSYKQDPLSVPLRNSSKQWRTVSDDDGECSTDFIIIPDKWGDLWGTEDEYLISDDIEDFIFTTVGYHSGYDFPTGKTITLRWSFKRLPCGVGIVHDRGINW